MADAASASVSMVGSSVLRALTGTLSTLGPVLAVAVVLVFLVCSALVTLRVCREVRAARGQTDPRSGYDPLASDVLGEA